MSETSDRPIKPAPRRPPAPPSQWATVTPLRAARPVVPAASRTQGSLALVSAHDATSPGGSRARGDLRLVPSSAAPGEDVQVWATRFAQAVVEVLGGDRPLSQLVRWTSQRVYLELERRLRILRRTSDAGIRMRTVRPQVRSVHVFHPSPESAEVSVHVRHGQRSRAIAARLELHRGRWQCTVLLLG